MRDLSGSSLPRVSRSTSITIDDLVRGVLCVRCNNALGQLQESSALAARAFDYLDAGGFAPSGVYDLHDITVERARGLVRAAG